MKKMIIVGKLNKKSENINSITVFEKNNSIQPVKFISDKIIFRTSGYGLNYEIHELITSNGLVFRKYIPL